MAIFDLFSKRQKRLRGEVPDVFTCDFIHSPLRVQIVHIIRDVIGEDRYTTDHHAEDVYEFLHKAVCREYGVFKLGSGYNDTHQEQLLNYFLKTEKTAEAVDIIELSFRYFDTVLKEDYWTDSHHTYPKLKPDDAIAELNDRFKEHGVGYAFEAGEIIRIDSTYIHSEITKPTISLLWNNKFKGANEEYLKGHEHYRHGRNKECLAECLKAFESTLKIICQEKGWAFNQTDTAKRLIQICFQNGLVPTFTQNQFTSLQNLLESGIPTIRNKLGGHGQGQIPQKVDDEMTRYGLNLTGTNIIFLIEQTGIK
ncbi:MAG: hypothetical protein WKF97_25405 [Chitinophagaceae bacterium]